MTNEEKPPDRADPDFVAIAFDTPGIDRMIGIGAVDRMETSIGIATKYAQVSRWNGNGVRWLAAK